MIRCILVRSGSIGWIVGQERGIFHGVARTPCVVPVGLIVAIAAGFLIYQRHWKARVHDRRRRNARLCSENNKYRLGCGKIHWQRQKNMRVRDHQRPARSNFGLNEVS